MQKLYREYENAVKSSETQTDDCGSFLVFVLSHVCRRPIILIGKENAGTSGIIQGIVVAMLMLRLNKGLSVMDLIFSVKVVLVRLLSGRRLLFNVL